MTLESAVLIPLFAGREYLKSTADIVLGRIEASHKDNGVARAMACRTILQGCMQDACRQRRRCLCFLSSLRSASAEMQRRFPDERPTGAISMRCHISESSRTRRAPPCIDASA
jgi:hypothetical protein